MRERTRRDRRGRRLQHDAVSDGVPALPGRADHRAGPAGDHRGRRRLHRRQRRRAGPLGRRVTRTPSRCCTRRTPAARPRRATAPWRSPPAATSSSSAPTTTSAPRRWNGWSRTADELDADIVLGRLVGAGGRVVNQAVFDPGDRDDIDLVNSALPWALSNTKLFRRSMLEEHGIRYPEELRSGSDQPFTLRGGGRAPGGSRCAPTTTSTTRYAAPTPATSPTGRRCTASCRTPRSSWTPRPTLITDPVARAQGAAPALHLGARQAARPALPRGRPRRAGSGSRTASASSPRPT